jgi:2-polyprenyl-6-methoxyphenol hydroxylase-like FAD-dependent oxidoreductase
MDDFLDSSPVPEITLMPQEPMETIQCQCCIAGGGPAGMVAGLMLARAGIEVIVLEKHADFLRDFRGDTIHPSTLEVMRELGLLDQLLTRPHQKVERLGGVIGGKEVTVADFTHLPTHCGFIALMPQWDFLDFLSDQARQYPSFRLLMRAEVTELIEGPSGISGVRAITPRGLIEVLATLTIGCDGRHSTVRERAKLQVDVLGAPIDVLWMRLSRKSTDPDLPLGRFNQGRVFVMIDREDYWQCGFVIPKGGIEEIQRAGIQAFQRQIIEIAPFVADRVDEIQSWDDVKLLTVSVDRLRRWSRPGLLCIGDAAHAMSPIGGVGINLAIQDAVAAANLLSQPLISGTVDEEDLLRVQRRREFPTKVTQRVQILIQDRVISRVLAGHEQLSLPWPLKLLRRFPILRRIPARLIGLGIRPEHVQTRERLAPRNSLH